MYFKLSNYDLTYLLGDLLWRHCKGWSEGERLFKEEAARPVIKLLD